MASVSKHAPSGKKDKKSMPGKNIHFIGFLANTDASILQMSFDHGFRIEAFSQDKAVDLISTVAEVPSTAAGRILFIQFPFLNLPEKQVYVIRNSLKTKAESEEKDMFGVVADFDNKLIHGYLNSCLRLIRLFKEGNLVMPLTYYYLISDGKPSIYMSKRSGRYISREPYHLESSELLKLHRFLRETRIPFERAFLQLAFENLELSYEIPNIGLSFLTLMISLETLLNPGERELKYRISRNTAVLLGNDREESKAIFSEIKKLYDKRSKVVHTGESNIIKKKNVLKLRHYVRESIKKMYQMKRSKDDILNLLNSHGFGERVTS